MGKWRGAGLDVGVVSASSPVVVDVQVCFLG